MALFRGCDWVSMALPTCLVIAGSSAQGPDAFWNMSGSLQGEEGEESVTNLRGLHRLLLGCNLPCATQLLPVKQGKWHSVLSADTLPWKSRCFMQGT